jgi:hypothetical protein
MHSDQCSSGKLELNRSPTLGNMGKIMGEAERDDSG